MSDNPTLVLWKLDVWSFGRISHANELNDEDDTTRAPLTLTLAHRKLRYTEKCRRFKMSCGGLEMSRRFSETRAYPRSRLVLIKYVSKVRGQLCNSRKLYIASVTIHPEGRQFHATDKICKKVQEIVYWCGH